ncbi:DUF2085 domain-containing protein [Lyngbya confervoides]|uniref:DUF2085 domain-containing protein n=1 Tax=Lyngbya confervoides BDU141951 TaxID=1574623 RepID=A0ABD4T4G6_9CYAN|nr:DUF2085 domain-containing protein [Lyngbya confervoides]MCM1983363.1 DUF2085 domain-containing protein [Lyngbya confervoides BDU141951]
MNSSSSLPWFSQRPLRSYLADFVLVGLVSGPLAAPFLASTSLPLLPQIANLIYTMGQWVCPQPEMGLMLWPPHLMAVCMRCYGTLMGLMIMRYLVSRSGGQEFFWLHRSGPLGLVICGALCLVYPAELYAQIWGWWDYHNPVVTLFGLIAGLGLGAYIMPLLHPVPKTHNIPG